MHIIDRQLKLKNKVVADLPLLGHAVTVRVWEVSKDYQPSGYFVSTGNEIPACDHGAPVFTGLLDADLTTVATKEFDLHTKQYTGVIQKWLDETAQSKGFDSMLSAVTYDDSLVTTFRNDAMAAKAWRDSVWQAAYTLFNNVKNGTDPMPESNEALLALLPAIVWPQ